MKEAIKPLFLAVGGGAVIEYISSSEFELLYKYGTQTATMFFSMYMAYKHFKNNKNKNS